MKQLKIITSIFFFILLFSCQSSNKNESYTSSTTSKDTFNFLPTSTTGQVVHHDYYSLSYHEEYENAEWTAYSLSPQQIKYQKFKRPYFIRDPKVKSKSAHYKNYFPNGYEKGHLVPAADMRFDIDAYDDTFYTSNVSPMNRDFNSGIWNMLEKQVRYWVKRYGKLYIVSGGVLQPELKRIGKEEIAVPDYFYKIVLDYNHPRNPRIIGFLIPHKNIKKDLKEFVVPVDSIEKITGIDFFYTLPDKIENKIEAVKHPEQWKFIKFKKWER